MVNNNKIISFESIECAGKTTQIEQIYSYFKHSRKILKTSEPTNNPIGNIIRESFSSKSVSPKFSVITELMLFMANRSYHIDTLLESVSDSIILIDRYVDSSIVYQGIIKGFDKQFINDLNDVVTKNGLYTPDLTIVLDIDPIITMERIKKRKDSDINDLQSYDFHKKAQLGFQQLALIDTKRIKLINANQSPDNVFNDILKCLNTVL